QVNAALGHGSPRCQRLIVYYRLRSAVRLRQVRRPQAEAAVEPDNGETFNFLYQAAGLRLPRTSACVDGEDNSPECREERREATAHSHCVSN
ncbi:MAG: hypothetical protein J2P29_03150, partial [Actinobacteria bacterium]|nr:hypothetical protein [Actinomycetota bacterium]